MDLIWLQYQNGSKSQYYLVFVIMEKEDRYIGLMTKDVLDPEIEKIRKNLPMLKDVAIGERVAWLRANVSAYSRAYKEFRKDRIRVDSKFELSELK